MDINELAYPLILRFFPYNVGSAQAGRRKMNISALLQIAPCNMGRIRTLKRRILPFCLSSIFILNMIACKHEPTPGNHDNNKLPPQTIELVASLIGAAAEVGVLALTRNPLYAVAASGIVGAGATYVIKELGLSCDACGNLSNYKDQPVPDGAPKVIKCDNPNCQRFVYLVVCDTQVRLDSMLQQLKANLGPTCLLMKELTDENEIRLNWVSYNATDASLNGERVSLKGSLVVYPEHTTPYVLKVVSANGTSEDKVVVEVVEETEPDFEPEPEDDPPAYTPAPEPPLEPPSAPTPPVTYSTRVAVRLDQIEVYEDGSIGATDWSFEILLNGINLMLIPRRSYHDDERHMVQFRREFVQGNVPGNELYLTVSGYNFDDHKRATGGLRVPVDMISASSQMKFQVGVPGDYKKGYFIFYVTIER